VLSAWYRRDDDGHPLRKRQELPRELVRAPGATSCCCPNPNPPLGTLFSRQEIARLCEERPDRLVVIDRGVCGFLRRATWCRCRGEYANLAIVRTFSKSFSLAGARVGYLLARQERSRR